MRTPLILLAGLTILGLEAAAQAPVPTGNAVFDPILYQGLEFRMVGPYRGGRSTAVAGVASDPATFFMGTTGGGMWKTDDYGVTWNPISDDDFGGSVGAVAVAPSDPNVIYVGTGSVDIRGNTSTGRGVWKSMDGGKTWEMVGLEDAGQIGRIEVHPRDADLVYLAALGHPFGKNETRGVYRSMDGGDTWENVLFLNDSTGVADLSMNPRNPREIYAGAWRGERKPWAVLSGGPEGGVYKTTDGGESWNKLAGGLPEGLVGKVGVSVSPANPERVWAILEAEPDGGVYRSDDAGESWTRVNSENKLRQRAWYYTHVQADPQDQNTVYALNTSIYRSVDGGRTFDPIPVPHGDLHDLWINPDDPDVMIVGDDGGGQVSVNGGSSWSTYHNQPTAELYDVIVDNGFPYRLYGAQQDNTTISVPVWVGANQMHPKEAWLNVGGCETGPVALHPDRPEIVYAGCYGGVIDRYDLTRDQVRNINLYPQLQLGSATRDLRYRFQWVSPMVVSPHDPDVLYHGSQYVHRTRDGGMTWETLSPDLTTDNPDHQHQSGGPINADVTGVEIYNVVFSLAVSPHTPDVIWAGTDDGRVWISRDEGVSWNEITPPDMPELGTVDEIDPSVHVPGRAVMAVQRYRMDDFAPYVYVTDDYGESWRRVTDGTNGIPADYPVRTVREDPVRQGLLFAGTEFGLYASFDDGANWQSLQLNLPITPVTGMRVAHGDIAISTQGRSFWVLDDMTPLRELTSEVADAPVHLFQPRDAYRVTKGGGGGLGELGPAPAPSGASIHYSLAEGHDAPLTLEVLDQSGGVVRTFSSDSASATEARTARLETDAGQHRVYWDLTYPGPEIVESAVIWGYTGGVKAPPGEYRVRLTSGDIEQTASFRVLKDPRLDNVTQADFEEQFRVAMAVRDSLTQVGEVLEELQGIMAQIDEVVEKAGFAGQSEAVTPLADTVDANLTEVQEELMQTRNQSGQDPIRFPPKLDNQWVELYNFLTGVDGYISGGPEGRPTAGAMERYEDLNAEWRRVRGRYQGVLNDHVRRFNELVERLGLPAVVLKDPRIVS